MSFNPFNPTKEQERIISHAGSAFIAACPGSGKTRVLVERTRYLLTDRSTGKGLAFLSFTNAAVSELENRLRQDGLLLSPPFPNFIGTFDSFLWQFLVAPFDLPQRRPARQLIKPWASIAVNQHRFISCHTREEECRRRRGRRLPGWSLISKSIWPDALCLPPHAKAPPKRSVNRLTPTLRI